MKSQDIAVITIWAYILIGIVAFGHSASQPGRQCYGGDGPYLCGMVQQAVAGVFAGALWPLYFSWVVADGIRA